MYMYVHCFFLGMLALFVVLPLTSKVAIVAIAMLGRRFLLSPACGFDA